MDNSFEHLRSEVIDGKLRLDNIIGTGDKCVLFCGTHLLLNRVVAVKMFAAADAEFVAQGSKQNMRESQHMQKVLTTGTAADLGYAVFELNEKLSAADMMRAYGLSTLSDDYVQVLERARAAHRRRQVRKVVVACAVVLVLALAGIGYARWTEMKRAEAQVTHAQDVRKFAEKLLAQKGFQLNDVPKLNELSMAAGDVKTPVTEDQRQAYLLVASEALSFANNPKFGDPSASHDAFIGAMRLLCVPGCADATDLRGRTMGILSDVGDRRRPQWLVEVWETYSKNMPTRVSASELAAVKCGWARQLAKCEKTAESEKLFDENMEAAVAADPGVITGAAITKFDAGKDAAAEALVSRAVQWAKTADPKKDFAPLRQAFIDLEQLHSFDAQAEILGDRVYAVSAADPDWAAMAWYKHPMPKVDRDWEMMLVATKMGSLCEREGKLAKALEYYLKAKTWIGPGWPEEWASEFRKPDEAISRLNARMPRDTKS